MKLALQIVSGEVDVVASEKWIYMNQQGIEAGALPAIMLLST